MAEERREARGARLEEEPEGCIFCGCFQGERTVEYCTCQCHWGQPRMEGMEGMEEIEAGARPTIYYSREFIERFPDC